MDKRKDYYTILGVPRDASVSAIKRAFRRLARKNRPESGPVPETLAELKAAGLLDATPPPFPIASSDAEEDPLEDEAEEAP